MNFPPFKKLTAYDESLTSIATTETTMEKDLIRKTAIEFAKYCIKSIDLEVAESTLQNDFDKFITSEPDYTLSRQSGTDPDVTLHSNYSVSEANPEGENKPDFEKDYHDVARMYASAIQMLDASKKIIIQQHEEIKTLRQQLEQNKSEQKQDS